MIHMNTVATNIRFSQNEYQEIKRLAFSQGKSLAAVVREALSAYRKNYFGTVRSQVSLAQKMRQSAVSIDVSVASLISDGRKP